jgi:hypothetical protein
MRGERAGAGGGRWAVLLALSVFFASCGRAPSHPHDAQGVYSVPDAPTQTQLQKRDLNRREVQEIFLRMGKLLPADQEIRVRGFDLAQCGRAVYSYTARFQNEILHLRTRIFFKTEGHDSDPATRRQLIERALSCNLRNQSFWLPFGIDYEIENVATAAESDFTVQLSSQTSRTDMGKFYLGNDGTNLNGLCEVYIHEAGHFLGIPDEYSESKTCRRSEYAATADEFPVSHWANFWGHETAVLPRHARQIADQIVRAFNKIPGPIELLHASEVLSEPNARDKPTPRCKGLWFRGDQFLSDSPPEEGKIPLLWFNLDSPSPDANYKDSSVLYLQLAQPYPFRKDEIMNFICAGKTVSSADVARALAKQRLFLHRVPSRLGAPSADELSLYDRGEKSDPSWPGRIFMGTKSL